MEPSNLKRWKVQAAPDHEIHFYTCARPGRPTGSFVPVPDSLVSTWVCGLPGPRTAIISLLGRKPSRNPRQPGLSEFSFYTFCGGFDSPEERGDQPTFQDWLNAHHADLQICVLEHPTNDWGKVPTETLDAVATDFYDLVSAGRTVVIMDSAGVTRTRQVRTHLSATQVALPDPNAKR